ncbi:MAG: glycoside hydrolase family 16 protein, partial [Planctomycetota bacterium]
FEARMRLDPNAVSAGIVNGFFTFDLSGDGIRDEIDFELLGNQAVGSQDIFTNVFDDAPFTGVGSGGNPALNDIAGFDLTDFNNYKIEWTPQAVKWFVNDSLVRTDTANVPDDPQKLHFNIWAPDSDFTQAFSSSLQPAATEGANQRFTSQVDWVEVNRINTQVSGNLLTDPSFETSNPSLNQSIGTTTGEWFRFNQASIVLGDLDGSDSTLPDVDPGSDPQDVFLAKTFGPFFGNTDASGLVQQVSASPGEEFEVTASAITELADSIAGTENFTTVQLAFADSNGNVLETSPFVPLDGSDFPLLDGRDPNLVEGVFVEGTASAVAPEGTAFARVTLLFVQIVDGTPGPNGLGGSVFFDDVSLVRLVAEEPPTVDGDYNNDTLVNAADYAVFRDGASPNSFASSDYDAWVANFGSANAVLAAVSTTVAVPEPAGWALILVSAAFVGRRRR